VGDLLPLTDDYAKSSYQSKYVKFLAFLKDNAGLIRKKIIFTDHQEYLQDSHIQFLLKEIGNKSIFIRQTPTLKTSVWEEYEVAQQQQRYVQFNTEVTRWIQQKINSEGYSPNNRVCNTGLIVYNTLDNKVFQLVDEMNIALNLIQSPECQIFWTILSQKYLDIIKAIPYNQINPPLVRKIPFPTK
jgi:type III secretory pathway component EscV